MRAVFFERFGGPLSVERVDDPAPAAHGVVLATRATGLCRSDWHGWMGHDPDIALPHVPGHELAGVVEAVGAEISRWRPGDRVTLPFVCGCGACPQCENGNHQVCDRQFQPGFTAWGSYAEYVAIDYADTNLVALPEDLDFVTAASLGCRFATAFRGLVDLGRVAAGQWVAVYGCGGVGLSAVMIARAFDARVVAVDIAADKLAFATQLGAEATIDASATGDVPAAVREVSGGGAHISVDALGHPQTCFDAILSLRKRGRHVQIGLTLADQAHPAVPMDRIVAHELQILGSHGIQAHRYAPLLEMVGDGRLDPARLVGRTIDLDAAPAELAAMDDFAGLGMTVVDRF